MGRVREQWGATGIAAATCWVVTGVLAVIPFLFEGIFNPVRLVVVPAASAAATLTVRVWILQLRMPADRSYDLGYRHGLADGVRAGSECPNVVDLRPGQPRRGDDRASS